MKEGHAQKQEFIKAQESKNLLEENKNKFQQLQLRICHQPAPNIAHVVLKAFQHKNPKDIQVLCVRASEQARAIIEQDSIAGPRLDKFNRPVDVNNLCEEEICAIHLYTQVRSPCAGRLFH